jgi:hypothetical protein
MMNRLIGVLLAGLVLTGCDLDLNDPNLPTTEDVLTTRDGLTQLAVGLQAEYSGQLVDPIYVAGLVADEIGTGGATFESYQNVDSKTPDPALAERDPSIGPWDGQYRVIEIANNLLANVPDAGFGPGTTSGIMALAEFYRGLAFANLATIYEAAPIQVGLEHPEPAFSPREVVLDTALALFQSAISRIESTAPSDAFNSTILADGFDLLNTARAMLARYALVAGDYTLAMQAAAAVDPTVLSVFGYSGSDSNPMYGMWYASGNAYQMRAEDAFRLEAEAGDQRVDYWVTEADIEGAIVDLDDLPRMDEASDPFHAYLPDEMKLIMAEVYVRRDGDIGSALDLVNEVREQCESALDEPVACLPALDAVDVPTEADMLAEILRQRRYELYLQGVRWADFRRFGIALPAQYEYMPTPQAECDRNDNAGC